MSVRVEDKAKTDNDVFALRKPLLLADCSPSVGWRRVWATY